MINHVRVKALTIDILCAFMEDMREEDKQEAEAYYQGVPFKAMSISELAEHNPKALVLKDGTVLAIGGFEDGEVWMMCTNQVFKHQIIFLKATRVLLKEILKEYGYLHNIVWKKNTVHIKWLKWLGATFVDMPNEAIQQFGDGYKDFKYFYFSNKEEGDK